MLTRGNGRLGCPRVTEPEQVPVRQEPRLPAREQPVLQALGREPVRGRFQQEPEPALRQLCPSSRQSRPESLLPVSRWLLVLCAVRSPRRARALQQG